MLVVAILQMEVLEDAAGQDSQGGGDDIVRFLVCVLYLHSLLGRWVGWSRWVQADLSCTTILYTTPLPTIRLYMINFNSMISNNKITIVDLGKIILLCVV